MVDMPGVKSQLPNTRLVRVADQDAPAAKVVAEAITRQWSHCQIGRSPSPVDYDYTQIDPTLQQSPGGPPTDFGQLQGGLSYAGLTPQQRNGFLKWSEDPTTPAPLAFQQLYLAHLEVNLLEGGQRATASRQALLALAETRAWQGHEGLTRTAWLACWLAQDGEGLANWPDLAALPPAQIGKFLGNQALLGTPLQPRQWASLIDVWQLGQERSLNELTILLRSLTTNLGGDPLAVALSQLSEQAQQPQPWRTFHRDLRLAWCQPDLRSTLTPLLSEALQAEVSSEVLDPDEAAPEEAVPPLHERNWHVILEFGHSRSDLFHFALILAQRQPGFSQLLDEDRKVVYRVIFRKQEMRQFWRLWDYVQSWSATRVYVNGVELEKWKVYPYSQFMR
jgi:hypothetical protein